MMNRTAGIELFEERHAAKVILLVHAKGPICRTGLYRELEKGIPVVLNRVNSLIDAGLIKETILPVRPFTKTLELTPKGRRVAELLAKVEEELRNEA